MGDTITGQPVLRPLPLSDLPLEGILARVDELAKRWALALIAGRPLDRASDLSLADLAREAPSLCAQLIGALRSDVELGRLIDDAFDADGQAPARRLRAVTGARDPAALVGAVEALRAVLWEALREHLQTSAAERLADVCDRLAWVCASALAATMVVPETTAAEPGSDAAALDAGRGSAADRGSRGEHRDRISRAVIVDELAGVTLDPARWEPTEGVRSEVVSPPQQRAHTERPPAPRASPPMPGVSAGEIEIRDERAEAAAAGWIGSIARQLERIGREGLPVALLLVEVFDLDELRRTRGPAELERIFAQLEEVLALELGRLGAPGPAEGSAHAPARTLHPGALVPERAGRYWLIAPRTDRTGARELAERLVRASAGTLGKPGTPLELLVGSALCPEDGREAAALAAHADVALYAARAAARAAAGRRQARVDEPA